MSIVVQPVTPDFAAEIGDVDLSRPLAVEDEAAIRQAFWKYAVLVFPEQRLDEDGQLAFARRFGPLETSIRAFRPDEKTRLKRAEMSDISNMDDKGALLAADSRVRMYKAGNKLWHTDSSFKYVPARASLLYAKAIPPIGGHTEFADTRAAWDALPDETKARLDGLVAEHSLFNSRTRIGFGEWTEVEREKLEIVPQAMVRTHADSGRRHLYVASHAGRVFGMPEAEGRALIDELLAHCSRRQFVYTHRWRVGDLVMWDDRCTLHRGTDYDDLKYKRDMMRATVSDEINSAEREGLKVDAA